MNNNCESLTDLLCLIVKLQKQGQCVDNGIQSCDRPFLGINNSNVFNTRPITLYTCPGNVLWTMPFVSPGPPFLSRKRINSISRLGTALWA